MTLFSFDMNASRVRAVQGTAAEIPCTVALEPPHAELPVVVSMEGGRGEAGTPGLLLMHERPDLVYRRFLPLLGAARKEPAHKRAADRAAHEVSGNRHPLTSCAALSAEQAIAIVLGQLKKVCRNAKDVVFALPPYLEQEQKELLFQEAKKAGFAPLASVAGALALGLAAHAENPWTGSVLVIDVDDHALWISLLQESDGVGQTFLSAGGAKADRNVCPTNPADRNVCPTGQARLVETYHYPRLNLGRWKQRLLDALADCCILQSRRDPRDFPAAEQSLYLQLDELMENCVQNRAANVTFQTANWYQHLVLQPEDVESFCSVLVRPLLADIQKLFQSIWPERLPSTILMSAQAATLPGLAVSLEELLDRWLNFSEQQALTAADVEDFGAHLLEDSGEELAEPQLYILSADAAARGAHLIASAVAQGRLEPGHLIQSAPLPAPQPLDAGPARLHFQGRDYLLRDRNFTLGRRYDCDLVLDQNRFPGVSPWHCEIICDLRCHFLKDRSREGTWLNDRPVTQVVMLRPGDRIRLGPNGPVIRYLGQQATRGLSTIA